jgi:hypothetical protein
MRLGIMQPYFMPYLGYYQLIAAVDVFVLYDNIKYTKKGWINRNRMLLNGTDAMFSLPLKNASDALDVVERELAPDFSPDKLLRQFRAAYSRAPEFARTWPLLQAVLETGERNLFRFIHRSLLATCAHLGLDTEIRISSPIPIDHTLKAQDKVLALSLALGADTYINSMGGVELYSPAAFRERNIELRFIRPMPLQYPQFGGPFVPWLSIIDVLMFNPLDVVRGWVRDHRELT